MKLTAKNYFTDKNTYLSNSKIGDFLKDKRFFFQKHIEKIIPHASSDALIIGSAVDCLIFEGEDKFHSQYVRVDRRSSKFDSALTQLNNTQWNMVQELAGGVIGTTAFKELKKAKTQVVLSYDMDVGEHFTGICGMLDWLEFDKKTGVAIITDLKTSKTIDEKKYYFHCLTYGYIRQLGMYGILVAKNFPVKKIKYQHLVVEKDPFGMHHAQTFIFENALVEREQEQLLTMIDEIRHEKEFAPWDTSFKTAIVMSDMREV